jgi:MFS family permease
MKKIFSNLNFMFLMAVQTVEQIGDSLTLMALIAWAMQSSGASHASTANMTIILFWIGVPILLVGPFSGVLIDRFKRKNLLASATASKGIFIFLIYMYMAGYSQNAWPAAFLYFFVFMKSFSTQFFVPAKSAFIPDVVGDESALVKANSLSATLMVITQIFTYAAAGILIAQFGYKVILLASAALYIPALLLILFINSAEKHEEKGHFESWGHAIADLKEGFVFMFSGERIKFVTRRVFVLMICAIVFYISLTGGFLKQIMVSTGLKMEDIKALGFIQAALGLGLVAGVVFLEKLIKRFGEINLIRIVFPAVGLVLSAVYFFRNFYFLLACGFLAGMAGVILLSIAETVVQKDSPADMRGRVFSAYYLFRNTGPLIAAALAGLLVRFLEESAIALAAVLCLVIYGMINLLFNKSRKS